MIYHWNLVYVLTFKMASLLLLVVVLAADPALLIWLFMLAEDMNANLAHVNTAADVASSVVSEILARRENHREAISKEIIP